ncbi:MAG: DUF2029 domain-containing protein [Bdellovibrionales bacterium]|nr:DUF2029 domain-containing protein [Bdellovibrionales bacterium]
MKSKHWAILFAFTVLVIFSVGSIQGFQLGAPDFRVFLAAGEHVWNGQPQLLYVVSPDRYLYAPGFAWFLSLLAPLGFVAGFWFWTALKIVLTPVALVMLSKRLKAGLSIAILTLLTVARPILIDLRYGQINLLVLLSLIFAVLGFSDWIRGERKKWVLPVWIAVSVFAVAKLYALPILLIPYFWHFLSPTRRNLSRIYPFFFATAVPFLFTVFLPVFAMGFEKGWALLVQWLAALQDKGFPMETHNQSFLAFVARQFTGKSAHVVGLYQEINSTWIAWVGDVQLKMIGLAWVLLTMGLILAKLFAYAREPDRLRIALLTIGILILPSHLVWKPYFVFALPLAFLAWVRAPMMALVATVLLNLSGFSILGLWWGPRLESASILFWAMLILYFAALRPAPAKA